jgi:hypothetical protein
MLLTTKLVHYTIIAILLAIYTICFLSVAYYTNKATRDDPTDPAKKKYLDHYEFCGRESEYDPIG